MAIMVCRDNCKMAVNVGSSSVKTSIFYGGNRIDVNMNFIGLERQLLKVKYYGLANHTDRAYHVTIGDDLEKAASVILNLGVSVLREIEWPAPKAVGHRVKFAGFGKGVERFTEKNVLRMQFHDYLSSRHNELCLAVLRETQLAFPSAEQLMVRDQITEDLSLHDVDRIPFDNSTIRRYGLYAHGFHGLAVKACLEMMAKRFQIDAFDGVVCQVGSGVSFTAISNGKIVFNTMQFAACDGPIMHNRSGTQPTGIALRFLKYGLKPTALPSMYSLTSGIYGLAGVPADSTTTVEDLLSRPEYVHAKNAYLMANGVELFRSISVLGSASHFIFSGGLATKHRWLGPELLLIAKAITPNMKNTIVAQLENNGGKFATAGGKTVRIVDIDEQACILNECERFFTEMEVFEIESGACEVPGTSVGVVIEGRSGWSDGSICMCMADSDFLFDSSSCPEGFIFFGKSRGDFFLRAAFARNNKIPAVFIESASHEPLSLINKVVYMDTPTQKIVMI